MIFEFFNSMRFQRYFQNISYSNVIEREGGLKCASRSDFSIQAFVFLLYRYIYIYIYILHLLLLLRYKMKISTKKNVDRF